MTKALFTAAALLLAETATAQQGPGGGPPPNRPTPVEAGELRETPNDRSHRSLALTFLGECP